MSDGPRLTFLGRLFILLFIAGCAWGAYLLFTYHWSSSKSAATGPANLVPSGIGDVELGVAYGTEKQRWLEWALGNLRKRITEKRFRSI